MKIFIGSSSHYVKLTSDKSNIDEEETKIKSTLYPIITFLRSKGHIVEPWWENGVLQKGEYLLDSLILKSHSSDAGIFVLRPDDLLKPEEVKITKNTSFEVGVPRGNVLIECGMFLGAKGKSRTFILKDGDFSKIKIPNDILAINYGDLSNKSICNELENFFENEKFKNDNKKTKFYLSNTHTENILTQKYKKWSSKALYIGSKSARIWKEIEEDDKSLIDKSEVKSFVREIHSNKKIDIDFSKINNVISLGPGCGTFDNEIISEVYKKNKFISYIPIDINPYLAFRATEYVKRKSPDIRIPFAIIEDFEENSKFVSDILQTKFHDLNQSCLFLMLGGTFSNLEGDEENVISKIESWMSKKDFLIIDVFIKESDYTFANDKLRQVQNLPASYKDFIINSIEKRHLIADNQLMENIKIDLQTYLVASETNRRKQYTNIESTSVVTYKLKTESNEQDILIAKRYDFENIKYFLTENFNLLHSFNGLKDGSVDKSDRGIFLLQKK